MKIKPVEFEVTPKYPDKYNEEIKRALACAKPNRWKGTRLAAFGASAFAALSLIGCTADIMQEYTTEGSMVQSPPVPTVSAIEEEQFATLGAPIQSLIIPQKAYIPLFEYGEGTGTIGCVSVTAPVFMSEEEAFAILSSAFEEAGLSLDLSTYTIESLNIPITDIYKYEDTSKNYSTSKKDFLPDGLIEFSLPVEFVSTEDMNNWHDDTGMAVSVSYYNLKRAAKTLTEKNPYILVFYDPVSYIDFEKIIAFEKKENETDDEYNTRFQAFQQEERIKALSESERLLRLQAEAFMQWLNDRGYY